MEILQMNTSEWVRWTENRFTLSKILSEEEPFNDLRITRKGYILLSVRNHILFCHTHFSSKIWTANCITQPQTYYSDNKCYHMRHLMTKPTKWHMRPAKTQISLGMCPIWSESSLSTWRIIGSLATHKADDIGYFIYVLYPHKTSRARALAGRLCDKDIISWAGSFEIQIMSLKFHLPSLGQVYCFQTLNVVFPHRLSWFNQRGRRQPAQI